MVLTPEEEVRQNFVGFLSQSLGYPLSLMANEIAINLNGTRKRCDTVVFSKEGKPLMIVEYKAPTVKLTQQTFNQILRYDQVLKAPFLVVTNGRETYCCAVEINQGFNRFLTSLPPYEEICRTRQVPEQ